MHRLRLFAAAVLVFCVVGVVPSIAQEEVTGDNAPAVVVDDDSAQDEEDAWTFRFLVPGLLGASGIVVVGVALGYAVRIRGRYRVTQ